jgi:hypothetical protein
MSGHYGAIPPSTDVLRDTEFLDQIIDLGKIREGKSVVSADATGHSILQPNQRFG